MFHRLVSHNEDIGALIRRGYAVGFDSNHLIVRDIPYLVEDLSLAWGAFAAKLDFIDEDRVKQTNHQVFFAGSHPHGLDRRPIGNIGFQPAKPHLTDACSDLDFSAAFSNKIAGTSGFRDLFQKMEHYVSIISAPAMQLHDVSPFTFRAYSDVPPDGIFRIQDTLTSRAGIGDLAALMSSETVAIIGAGGTGSYLFDFLAKSRVPKIRLFDSDQYHVHTVFRSPGAFTSSDFGRKKVAVYEARYANLRGGLQFVDAYIDSSSTGHLDGVTFAFVCVDNGRSRRDVFDALIDQRIPFIDVGMGLRRSKSGGLKGMLRVTYFPAEQGSEVRAKGWCDEGVGADDEYRTNMQIGELNSLNAALAIIRYKQVRGFYRDTSAPLNVGFAIGDLSLIGDSEL